MPEPQVAMTHPLIPGDEVRIVTQEQFDLIWAPLGWIIAPPELQPDVVYLLYSTMLGVPNGIATLDDDGNVVQPGTGGGGGVSVGTMNAAIAAAIALVTPASIGAIPSTTPVILYVDDVQSTPMRSTHPIANGLRQDYALTDGTCWVMAPLGYKTQVAPGFVNPTVILALQKTINSLTLSTVLTTNLEPDAAYAFEILGAYESTVAASGERIRFAIDAPPGATGWWAVSGLAVTQAAANGSASFLPKQFDETFDIGGSGAGTANVRYFRIHGTIYCDSHDPLPSTEPAFDFRARLTTLDGSGVALVPGKIYGADTADYDACRMTFTRFA